MRCAGEAVARELRGRRRRQVAAALAQRFARDGVPIRVLAAELDRRPSLVRRLLTEAGAAAEDMTCVGMPAAGVSAVLSARYARGVSAEQLSRETGIDRREVQRLVAEGGIGLRAHQPLPAEKIDWVVRQYRSGCSLRSLVELTGSSYSTVRRALLDAGITLRSRGGTPARAADDSEAADD